MFSWHATNSGFLVDWSSRCGFPTIFACGVCFISCTCRYKCATCVEFNKGKQETEKRKTSFNAWDAGCLRRLPEYISKEFPFLLTKRSGIEICMVDRLADDLVRGKGFSAAAKNIRQVNMHCLICSIFR